MLKAEQNTKSYLPANKRSNFDLNFSSHTNLPCENCCFVECSLSIRQQDIGILKMSPARYVAKKWIDEKLLNQRYLVKLH